MIRGVDVVRKVLHSSVVASSKRLISNTFNKHLFITNVTLSCSLSGLGDVLQQQHNIASRQQKVWDTARTRHMTCSGITVGALCHHWYILLDRRLPGRTMQVALKKLLVDQFLFSPICLAIFFFSLGLFKGGSWRGFFSDLQHKGWRLYVAEWLVWPPAQLINFYFLPTKFRVLFDNTVSLIFDIYTSHVCYDYQIIEEEDNQAMMVLQEEEGKEKSMIVIQEEKLRGMDRQDLHVCDGVKNTDEREERECVAGTKEDNDRDCVYNGKIEHLKIIDGSFFASLMTRSEMR